MDFSRDVLRGKSGELLFKRDFLDHLMIDYKDVTGDKSSQKIGIDFITSAGSYEVKSIFTDVRLKRLWLPFEEYSNYRRDCGLITDGWFKTTEADILVFAMVKRGSLIFVPLSKDFKRYYNKVLVKKTKFVLGDKSVKGDNEWYSAYRKVFLRDIRGYYSHYKKGG